MGFKGLVRGQQLPTDSLKGMESYNKLDYSEALGYLLRYNKKKPTRRNIYAIADCYRHIQNYSESEIWYKKAIDMGTPPSKIRFYYAESLQSNGKYYKAIKQYILTKPVDENEVKLTERRIFSCIMADSIAKLIPNRFEVSNSKEINSEGSEFGLIPFEKGKIFISDRIDNSNNDKDKNKYKSIYHWTDRGYLRMYYLEQDSFQTKTTITPFDKIFQNKFHSGPMVFNKAQDLVFYTVAKKVDPLVLTKDRGKIKDFINRLEIYYSQKVNGVWSQGLPVPFNNVLEYSVGHPALSPDDKTLYFISDMPGGLGGTDIYYVELGPPGQFGTPHNAGPIINTEGNERFPVFQPNGDLYFSSDGLMGLGGLDIFRTHGEKTKWLKPANLGVPVNSSKDDFGFLAQARNTIGGYFTSNRDGGLGSDDIYQFLQIRPLPPLEPVEGQLVEDSVQYTRFQLEAFPKDSAAYLRKYSLAYRNLLRKADSNKNVAQVVNKPSQKAIKLNVNNLGHSFDQYLLENASQKDADSVALILLNHPDTKLQIIGHADNRGKDAYNLKLSKKRAESVVEHLKRFGISEKRLDVSWVGSKKPLVPCPVSANCTEEEHAQNRRTELKIFGLGTGATLEESHPVPVGNAPKLLIPIQPVSKPIQVPDSSSNRISVDTSQTIKQNLIVDDINSDDIKILKDSIANHNELFNAFGEMSIDTIFINSRNLLVIKETDGTIQRIFLPKAILSGDQLIRDQLGNQWIIRRNRRVIKIKKE